MFFFGQRFKRYKTPSQGNLNGQSDQCVRKHLTRVISKLRCKSRNGKNAHSNRHDNSFKFIRQFLILIIQKKGDQLTEKVLFASPRRFGKPAASKDAWKSRFYKESAATKFRNKISIDKQTGKLQNILESRVANLMKWIHFSTL